MPMPKAAMHENRPPPTPVCKVWRAWQVSILNTKSMPQTVGDSPDRDFGAGVLLSHAAHANRRQVIRNAGEVANHRGEPAPGDASA
jgi:hypothetical protein